MSVMVNAPVTLLFVCGVKLILTEQLAPPVRLTQVLVVIANGWLAAMLVIFSVAPPVFVTVIV